MEEIWKPVVGYEGLYEVSNFGRVRSIDRWIKRLGKIDVHRKAVMLKQAVVEGYCKVHVSKNGQTCMLSVHRLVAMAFLPNPDNLPCVNHKDENPLNNVVSNLEWCSIAYNTNYGTAMKRSGESRGKPIKMISLDGEVLKVFKTEAEAAKFIGKRRGLMGMVANRTENRQTAYGYRWEWV